MMRLRTLFTDAFVIGSSVYQNLVIRKQAKRLESEVKQQIRFLDRQRKIEHFKEERRRNIIEKRKMLIRFGDFSEKAMRKFDIFPEYSAMMMEFANRSLSDNPLDPEDFEEMGDIEKASEIRNLFHNRFRHIRSNLTDDQSRNVEQMVLFFDSEEDEMMEHLILCKINEEWTEVEDKFAKVNEAHREKIQILYFVSSIPILAIITGFLLGLISPSLLAVIYPLIVPGLAIWLATEATIWIMIRITDNEWNQMNKLRIRKEISEEKFHELGNKFSTFSSEEISKMADRKREMIGEIIPREEEKILDF